MDVRLAIEKRELNSLHKLAAKACYSKGREREETEDALRTCFMVDRDRIIHSKSFRRLKHKTQVYLAAKGDHFRTRLTHTLEVNQIARTIGRGLALNEDLIEAIALGHDVGHTPFAHSGERALNRLLPGGFHHNENSVRVVTLIEKQHGLNLTHEVLDGIRCHSGFDKAAVQAETLEGQVIRLADKIAYVQHDIDDSVRAGLLAIDEIPQEYLEVLGFTHGQRIATLVGDVINESCQMMQAGTAVITLSPTVSAALIGLRKFMFTKIYCGPLCKAESEKAEYIVEYLFKYYVQRPEALPEFYQAIASREGIERAVADYIAGMSDNYCINMFQEVAIPRSYF
ncbi:MAG: deoxyguanosinetriphosphate triphosphohydrolase [Peptococcaceae bacterium]|nr:deoxyguanosinetriphosphate triphosphohydrolase [Peptococcaceae bacterium]